MIDPDKISMPFGLPPEGCEVWWRVEAKSYSVVIDADQEIYGSTPPRLEAYWHQVISHTPKGVWISGVVLLSPQTPRQARRGVDTFVLTDARKRFACPTLLEAVESFMARKARQIAILTAQLGRATNVHHQAQEYLAHNKGD